MQIIKSTDYQIEIGSILESSLESLILKNYQAPKLVIMVDENTNDNCLEYLLTNFDCLKEAEIILIPAGEENKVIDICYQVWESFSDYEIGRRDLLINLGGGVVSDMGGFIASIYKRGFDFIHIPTTLLAMVDASIGGKNGVDLGNFKNMLGTFKNPKAIYIDRIFLSTLEPHQIANGFAEVLKHALIKDTILWNELKLIEDLFDISDEETLKRIISIKVDVVNEDPFEKGIRKILNFGHTIGHGMEGYFLLKDPIDHGHAVALGILAESYLSKRLGKLNEKEFSEIEAVVLDWFRVPLIEMADIQGIIEMMRNDKKNHSGKIQCCLLEGIGKCVYDQAVEEHLLIDSLVYLMSKSVPLN